MTVQSALKVRSLLPLLEAQWLTDSLETDITGCYIADLLSDVLAHAEAGIVWVTIQTHRNVVSVAAMKDVAAVVITCGRKPDAAVIAEAEREGVVLLSTPLTTYETAGKLWEAGIR